MMKIYQFTLKYISALSLVFSLQKLPTADVQDFTQSSCFLALAWLSRAPVPTAESPNITQHKINLASSSACTPHYAINLASFSHLSLNLFSEFGFIFPTKNIKIIFQTILQILKFLKGYNLPEKLHFEIKICDGVYNKLLNFKPENTSHHLVTLLENKTTYSKKNIRIFPGFY